MSCPHVTAFLSCSFQDADKGVNDYFKGICEALNINCKNVSDGYSSTPPETARRMIEESKIVLAIITRRDEISTGKWTMPSAVHEEMAMAFALKRPSLLIVENGVSCDGFISNFGTFIKFERGELSSNEFIKKTVSSIHHLRMQAVEQNNMLPEQDAAGFFADKFSSLIELVKENGQPAWQYNNTRKLIFLGNYDGQIKNSAWASFVPEDATEKIKHSLDVRVSRAEITPTIQIIKDTPNQLEIGMDFDPKPQKDDWIEIEFIFSSPHLNPLTRDHITEDKRHHVSGKIYDSIDGVIPIQPIRDLHIQFRFPSWYAADKDSIFPFVGSYSSGVDYVVESEIKRCDISISTFGASTQVDLKVESPLMRHVYGLAWNLL